MSEAEKMALVRDLLTRRDVDEARRHPGLVETISTVQMLSAAFSDVEASFPLQFCQGDWVATRAVFKQTHTGTFFGIPATNKRIENEVLFLHRVVDGQIIQQYSQADAPGMLAQMGVRTVPGSE
ncbi:MAG: ester cyclase [Anaerolineales bacterium]|nr:ester cyclase [Anaerolineales bacterium]